MSPFSECMYSSVADSCAGVSLLKTYDAILTVDPYLGPIGLSSQGYLGSMYTMCFFSSPKISPHCSFHSQSQDDFLKSHLFSFHSTCQLHFPLECSAFPLVSFLKYICCGLPPHHPSLITGCLLDIHS